MKIGLILPGSFTLSDAGNGVRAQAEFQAEALERAGHDVRRMDPWQAYDGEPFDVVQFFLGGFAHYGIEKTRPESVRMLVFAPIIDTNESNWRYRLATRLGGLTGKVFTVPGVFRQQARDSDLVICRSNHERERIVRGLGVDPEKTEIVLNGVDSPTSADSEMARQRYKLNKDFLLHVSAYTQERKNVVRLVEAVGPTGYPLVIAGSARPGPVLDRIQSLANQYGNIKLLGFLDREELNSLYTACRVFCLPSIHEGTGLVALEAASYGASVVITKNGGPPDYFVNLAEYVNPYSVSSIRQAVVRAWNAPHGGLLRQHVLENLTWDQSACSLLEAYQRHLGS
ncbi:MAG: glycosyltransferase family 4 protein [Planctomycetes bacterium]|nr:glycosyltransferase family 4 protein [Planctomycetota bacterium]